MVRSLLLILRCTAQEHHDHIMIMKGNSIFITTPATSLTMVVTFFAFILLSFFSKNGSTMNIANAFVSPSSFGMSIRHGIGRSRSSTNHHEPLRATPLVTSHILESISAVALGDTSTAVSTAAVDAVATFKPMFFLGGLLTAIVLTVGPLVLADATRKNNDSIISNQDQDLLEEKEETVASVSRRVPSSDAAATIGVDRRGTLMTLVGGAMSFAASDILLGAAGSVLNGGKAAVTSTVYGAQWNGLYQRVASLTARHEAAVASPELLAWISRSSAAFVNPELRAWVAAQRAFSKSRQVLATAAVLEEGVVTAGAVAAAAVATKQKARTKDGIDGDDDFETDVPSSELSESTSDETETLSQMNFPSSLTEEETTMTTTTSLNVSSSMTAQDSACTTDGKE